MNTLQPAMTPYLKRMVEENYLLTREAQVLQRLPSELHEKAIELSEAQRVPTMEKIVSDLLNPVENTPTTKPFRMGIVGMMLVAGFLGIFLGVVLPPNTTLAPPTHVTAQMSGSEGWTLSWAKSPQAHHYQVYVGDNKIWLPPTADRVHFPTLPALPWRCYVTVGDAEGKESPPSEVVLSPRQNP